jgi:hypothetical protein
MCFVLLGYTRLFSSLLAVKQGVLHTLSTVKPATSQTVDARFSPQGLLPMLPYLPAQSTAAPYLKYLYLTCIPACRHYYWWSSRWRRLAESGDHPPAQFLTLPPPWLPTTASAASATAWAVPAAIPRGTPVASSCSGPAAAAATARTASRSGGGGGSSCGKSGGSIWGTTAWHAWRYRYCGDDGGSTTAITASTGTTTTRSADASW